MEACVSKVLWSSDDVIERMNAMGRRPSRGGRTAPVHAQDASRREDPLGADPVEPPAAIAGARHRRLEEVRL